MNALEKAYEQLTDEHQKEYGSFTRLILTLSVGFITFSSAQLNDAQDLSLMFKMAVAMHAISIICGVLVQYKLMVRPHEDMQKILDNWEAITTTGYNLVRNAGLLERTTFFVQLATFLVAFILLVVGVII